MTSMIAAIATILTRAAHNTGEHLLSRGIRTSDKRIPSPDGGSVKPRLLSLHLKNVPLHGRLPRFARAHPFHSWI